MMAHARAVPITHAWHTTHTLLHTAHAWHATTRTTHTHTLTLTHAWHATTHSTHAHTLTLAAMVIMMMAHATAAAQWVASHARNGALEIGVTRALRAWLLRTHAHSLIVPTEYFASRRVRWIIARELNGTGAQVEVPAMDDPEYPRIEWWKNDKGLVEFQNEVIKYIYYRIKY